LQVAQGINVGVLYMFGVIALGVYGIMLGGWASNNKFSLMGAIRAASQSISYEIAMGLSLIALLMVTRTLTLEEIVAQQSGFVNWNIWAQPLGFIILWSVLLPNVIGFLSIYRNVRQSLSVVTIRSTPP